MLAEWLADPVFCAEFDKLEDEFSRLDELLEAKQKAKACGKKLRIQLV